MSVYALKQCARLVAQRQCVIVTLIGSIVGKSTDVKIQSSPTAVFARMGIPFQIVLVKAGKWFPFLLSWRVVSKQVLCGWPEQLFTVLLLPFMTVVVISNSFFKALLYLDTW